METKYAKCPICRVELSGYGLDDLNRNLNRHINDMHSVRVGTQDLLSIEAETIEVKVETTKKQTTLDKIIKKVTKAAKATKAATKKKKK
jgi:hypothetical protein